MDARGLSGNIMAKRDQLAADREIIDHLRIIARGVGRDCGPGKFHKVIRATQLLQPLVIEEGAQGDRGGEVVLGDARGSGLEDAGMDRVVEMLWPDDGRDAVIDIVVGQDRAEDLLFGLDRMRHCIGGLDFGAGWIEYADLVHPCCPCRLCLFGVRVFYAKARAYATCISLWMVAGITL